MREKYKDRRSENIEIRIINFIEELQRLANSDRALNHLNQYLEARKISTSTSLLKKDAFKTLLRKLDVNLAEEFKLLSAEVESIFQHSQKDKTPRSSALEISLEHLLRNWLNMYAPKSVAQTPPKPLGRNDFSLLLQNLRNNATRVKRLKTTAPKDSPEGPNVKVLTPSPEVSIQQSDIRAGLQEKRNSGHREVISITQVPESDTSGNPAQELLRALQIHIMQTKWRTGIGGDIAMFYTNKNDSKTLVCKNNIPHYASKQLEAIENYMQIKAGKTPDEQIELAKKVVTKAFQTVPQEAAKKLPGFLDSLKRFLRQDEIQNYYSLFTPQKREELISALGLGLNKDAKNLLNKLIPPESPNAISENIQPPEDRTNFGRN